MEPCFYVVDVTAHEAHTFRPELYVMYKMGLESIVLRMSPALPLQVNH